MLGVCSLFIPASSPRMINTGISLNCTSLIFDLEDAVSYSEKDSARNLLIKVMPLYRMHKTAIRINPGEEDLEKDLKLFNELQVDYLIAPKASVSSVKYISAKLDEKGSDTKIAALIETAESLEDVSKIATASDRISGLLFGAEDYCLDMGINETDNKTAIMYARSRICNVARAGNLEALDTPFVNVSDLEGLREDAKVGKACGFTGKLAINPIQIDVIKEVFAPTKNEVEWAKKVIETTKDPGNLGKGAFLVNGEMVDLPIIKRAEAILTLHESTR